MTTLVTPGGLQQSLYRLLRPLARLMMAYGIDFPSFANLAKKAFVDSAAVDFPDDGNAITDSRISLLSGIHRREVKRLREELTRQENPPMAVSMGALVAARWGGDPTFLDTDGRPAALPRLARQGGESSFEKLVEGISKDIRPRAVLDEWLRLGVARLDEDDRVHLVEDAFVPAHGLEEKIFFFGKSVSDHLLASSHNLLDGQPPFLDRCVYYDLLTPESVEILQSLARELALQALQEVNRKALQLQVQDAGSSRAANRMVFGAYFYAEPESNLSNDAE